MKIIRISTDMEMSVHDFPAGNHMEQNHELCKLIGNDCRIYEHVMPPLLYSEFQMKDSVNGNIPGQCVSMLVDEEGRLKENQKPNLIGCYLYDTFSHGNPIVGNILFVGEMYAGDGIDFCGIAEPEFKTLETHLANILKVYHETAEEMKK